MNLRFHYIIIALFVSACASKKESPPKDLISENEMINLLVDIRLLEGAYSVKYREIDTSDFKIGSYYKKLFSEHGLTSEQFASSYTYYSKQDGKMPELENKVIEKLSETQARLEAEK